MLRSLCLGLGTIIMLSAGCAGEHANDEAAPTDDVSLTADGKADVFNGGTSWRFGGTIHPGTTETFVGAPKPQSWDRVAYTARLTGGDSATFGMKAESGKKNGLWITVYGPRKDNGKYAWLDAAITYSNNALSLTLSKKAISKDGIYLVVFGTNVAGAVDVSENCGKGVSCEKGCIIPLIYSPVCGIDGVTYGNGSSAACYDVPVAHAGHCVGAVGDACSSNADCGTGLYCGNQGATCGAGQCTALLGPVCPYIYYPVCGCDGILHGNNCLAGEAGTSVRWVGRYAAWSDTAASLVGSYVDATEDKPVRTYNLAANGTFTAQYSISPCPPGVTCVWSGIEYFSGTWSVAKNQVTFTYAGGTRAADTFTVDNFCSGQVGFVDGDGRELPRQ